MTKTTLKERVEIAKEKIFLSPEKQQEVVSLVKDFVISGMNECIGYYLDNSVEEGIKVDYRPGQTTIFNGISNQGEINIFTGISSPEEYNNMLYSMPASERMLKNVDNIYDMHKTLYIFSGYHFPYACKDLIKQATYLLEQAHQPTSGDISFPNSNDYSSEMDVLGDILSLSIPSVDSEL